jgi:hypothetical protein
MPNYCAECGTNRVGESGHLCGRCIDITGGKNDWSNKTNKRKDAEEFAEEVRKLVEATPLTHTFMFSKVYVASRIMNIEMDNKVKEDPSFYNIMR